MSKQLTLAAQFKNASVRYSLAQENCPHWDYEASHECCHACCDEMADAQQKYYDIKRKIKLAEAA
jgi:hypothetical protein